MTKDKGQGGDTAAKIDFSADRLLAIASDRMDDHDYIGALKMLNKNATSNGNDEDSFMMYAEAFDDMDLFRKSINGWFKYIDYAGDDADLVEAYEGLAINYMNNGSDSLAAYYYDRMLTETHADISGEERKEIVRSFLVKKDPPLRFTYPACIADYSVELRNGIELIRDGKYEAAVKEFGKVRRNNKKFDEARNYIAMCYLVGGNAEEAERECKEILADSPKNVQAYTTLAAAYGETGNREAARGVAEKLLSFKTDVADDIYKIATVCCECEMHEDAYRLFCRMEDEFPFDSSVLYFRAVSAYNCGKVRESLDTFDRLLTIYPNAVTADYWRSRVVRATNDKRRKLEKLEYFYRLPQREREEYLAALVSFAKFSDKFAAEVAEGSGIEECVHWCFDEGETAQTDDLKKLGAMCAVKAGMDDTVRDIMLDDFLSDELKLHVLETLCERGTEGEYGIVICSVYRRVKLIPLDIGRTKRKMFVRAYAVVFARFAILADDCSELIHRATTDIYERLQQDGRLGEVKKIKALCGAIIRCSQVKREELTGEMIYDFLSMEELPDDGISEGDGTED